MSVASNAAFSPKIAQISPIITTNEITPKKAAVGAFGGAQGGRIGEARRRLRRRAARSKYRPPLALRSCSEAQVRRRVGLPAPTGGLGGRRTAGWAEGDAEDAATDGALCVSEPTFVRTRTCSRVYSSAVYGASQPYI